MEQIYKVSDSVRDSHLALAEKRIETKVQFLRDSGYRQDAIVFTKNQLEDLESTIYDVLYANPRDAFQLLPLNTSVSPAATSYSYRMVSDLGAAKVVADGAQDRHMVDVDLTRTEQKIIEVGSGYTYTIGNQEAGTVLDFQYVQEKARVAAESIALAHNQYALFGGAGVEGGDSSITGFFNNAAVADATLTDADWTTVTAAGQYDSIADLIHSVVTGSSAVHRPTDCVLSTFVWNCISKTLLTTTSSESVLTALRTNYPDITFSTSESLTGAGTAGVDLAVAYERRADRSEYVASVIYDEASPDKAGFRWTVQSRGKMCGTITRYPLSMKYGQITVA